MFTLKKLAASSCAGAVFALALSGVVSAYTLTNVMVSSFKAPGPRGTVALTKVGAGTLTMSVSLVGLRSSSGYQIHFSARACRADMGSDIADVFLFMSRPNG